VEPADGDVGGVRLAGIEHRRHELERSVAVTEKKRETSTRILGPAIQHGEVEPSVAVEVATRDRARVVSAGADGTAGTWREPTRGDTALGVHESRFINQREIDAVGAVEVAAHQVDEPCRPEFGDDGGERKLTSTVAVGDEKTVTADDRNVGDAIRLR